MVLLKFPGNEILAGTFIDKAVELAVTEDEKVILLKTLASTYEKRKLFNDAALWYKKVVDLRKITTKQRIIKWQIKLNDKIITYFFLRIFKQF